jgi:hypothetical protein
MHYRKSLTPLKRTDDSYQTALNTYTVGQKPVTRRHHILPLLRPLLQAQIKEMPPALQRQEPAPHPAPTHLGHEPLGSGEWSHLVLGAVNDEGRNRVLPSKKTCKRADGRNARRRRRREVQAARGVEAVEQDGEGDALLGEVEEKLGTRITLDPTELRAVAAGGSVCDLEWEEIPGQCCLSGFMEG